MVDCHRFEKQYQQSLMWMWKNEQVCREDKESIEQFLKDLKSEGIGYARLRKLCQTLTMLGKHFKKGLVNANEKQLREVIMHYEDGEYSFWTRHDIKVIIKQFLKWCNKGEYPLCVKWINTTVTRHKKMQPRNSEILTEDEITACIEAVDHPRNKAFIAVLAESGARVGEIANLTISQISIDTNGAILNVRGKTGPRRLRIISSTQYLITWLNNHPDRENHRAPLWVNVGNKANHQMVKYEMLRKVIQTAFRRAGIKKRCNPYIFRHTRASQLAHHLTEYQMCSYFGWVAGSEMPSIYVHISGKDLDDHILKMNGIKPGEVGYKQKPKNRTCPRCKEINNPTALYCARCAEIVDPKLAIAEKMQATHFKADKIRSPFMAWLQSDSEMQYFLKKKMAEFRSEKM